MIKKLLLPTLIGLAMAPAIASSATLKELEDRITQLEEEVLIATEGVYDLSTVSESGMKLSGYADVEYNMSSEDGANDSFRMHHMNFMFLKDFGDKWRFFSEVEYEDAPMFESHGHEQGEDCTLLPENCAEGAVVNHAMGAIFIESVNFTYAHSQKANFRIGRTLTPAGIWNVNHYSSSVPTQQAPQMVTHDNAIFPSTLDGVQLFGTLPMGSAFLNYDLYAGNGRGENPGHGDNNKEKAKGAKLSFVFPVLSHFELGASRYSDEADSSHDGEAELAVTGYHGIIKGGPVTLQFEQAMGESDDGIEVHETEGYYAQLTYDWEKYVFGVRNDFYDGEAHDSTNKSGVAVNSLFLNYHVNTAVTLKVEHHMVDHESKALDDFNKTIFSVVGYLGN